MPKGNKTMADPRTALLQAFWRKALTTGKDIEFPHKTASDAKYFRLSLYRAVAKYREDPVLDAELHEATQKCAVGIAADKTTVVLRLKAPESHLLDIAAGLGIDVESLGAAPVDQFEAQMLESQRRVMERMKEMEANGELQKAAETLTKRENPYYKRDE